MPAPAAEFFGVSLIETVAQIQGTTFAVYHILMQIVIDLLAAHPNPLGSVKTIYEAISAKLDDLPLKDEQTHAAGYRREALAAFFSAVEKSLSHGQ